MMAKRREFTPLVYAQIVHRALNAQGHLTCEGCGLVLGKKAYHVDHSKPDGLEVDKTRKLTADDGKVLGVACCHAPKTKFDVARIAEAKRREAKHLGMNTRQPSRMAGSKASGIKRTIDGRVIDRATGREIRR